MTIDPYHFSEPLADDNLSDSQPKMQQNTDTLPKVLGRDHVPIGQPDAGRHQQINLKNLTQLPPAINGFSGLYNLNGKLTYRDSNGKTIPVPLDLNTFNQGYLNIGGFIIQMGTVNLKFDKSKKVSFPITFPSECRGVLLTVRKDKSIRYPNAKLLSWKQDSFECIADDDTDIFWVAFGR